MKRLIRRALAEVNQPQLRVNWLVRFYDRSPLNTHHAEKLVHTAYLTKLQQTTVAYGKKSMLHQTFDVHICILASIQTHVLRSQVVCGVMLC